MLLSFKSPILQKRLTKFKANKRAYTSFYGFLIVFIVTLFAEFICNERPLLIKYRDAYYSPIFVDYPETTYGGTFETHTNYRDPYVQELIQKHGWMIWPLIRFSPSTINYDLPTPAPSAPSFDNLFGTDDQGRDILTRLIYGLRTSILFGLTLTLGASFIGISLGAVQGYFGGKIDLYLQRFIEIWNGLPVLFLLIILSSMIEPNFWWLLTIMMLFSWGALVSVVRAEFFRARALDYVRAAEALGVSSFVIMRKHILPNAMISALTYMPFLLNGAIAMLTSLDFLGFGLPPGAASLGELITQAKNNIQSPWIGLTAFFSISILLSLLIFIGEGVRDAFDPRKAIK
jgi:microcin C transport system permease protein